MAILTNILVNTFALVKHVYRLSVLVEFLTKFTIFSDYKFSKILPQPFFNQYCIMFSRSVGVGLEKVPKIH